MGSIVEKKSILDKGSNINRMLKGITIAIILTLVLLFIFSCALTYSNISEKVIAPAIIVITAIAILAGSSISMRKINKNGMIFGSIIGLIYMLLIYLLSSAVSGTYTLSITSIILIVAGIVAGAIGGILGVNSK